MNPNNETFDKIDHLQIRLTEEIFEPRKPYLISELSKFLKQEKYQINERYDAPTRSYVKDNNFSSIKVFEFEYDQPLDFNFIGGASTITDDDWSGRVIIKPEDNSLNDNISAVMSNYNPNFQIFGTDLESQFRILKTALVRDYFSYCWIEAKRLTGSNQRCFLSEHDLSNYYDCDNKIESTETDIMRLRN